MGAGGVCLLGAYLGELGIVGSGTLARTYSVEKCCEWRGGIEDGVWLVWDEYAA